MVDAINHALKEEMSRNKKMLIFGQDIADPKGEYLLLRKDYQKILERIEYLTLL